MVGLQEQPDDILPIRSEGRLVLDRDQLDGCVDPRAYGTLLGEALFAGEIWRAFDRARNASQDRLHVLLFIEDQDLRLLRWERLCAPFEPEVWDYLSLNQRVPFSLYLPSTTDRRFPPITLADSRMLILAASPKSLSRYSLDEFDAPDAAAGVRTALGQIPSDILAFTPGAIGQPTLNDLLKCITEGSYSLLHLICHGQFQSDRKDTIVYLADEENEVDAVRTTRLIEELRRLTGSRGLPHFVFLSACEAGTPEAEAALGSLANRLVRELGIPAVVAMTGQVSEKTAQLLSTTFYQRLQEHGLVDLALVQAYAGLTDREDINVPVLYSRLGGRPLFQATTSAALTTEQIESGLDHLRRLLEERAPVLHAEFDEQAAKWKTGLANGAEQESKKALEEISTLCLEVLDLSFESLALGQQPQLYDNRCPFRGLYAFRMKDQEFFFGRERLIEKLRSKLEVNHFLSVLGPSGSGKSSVVLAGLIPSIQRSQSAPVLLYMTPGHEPLATLQSKLEQVAASADVTLVVDQFEELFTHGVAEAERKEFLALLLAQTKLNTVLTMRADFWGECAPYADLKERMQANQELIAAMDPSELRRAMDLQAEKVGLRFEADLSSQILDDVQDEPGAMPLVQHALQELWKRRHGRWLRAHEYRELGGVKMSIARTAEDVYNKLSDKDKDEVREIFLRLTRLDENEAEGAERRDTRQRVRLERLVPAEADLGTTRDLIKLLADARLVVTSMNARTGQQEVEVAHEALIRHWPRLRDWLDRDRIALIAQRRLSRAAEEWEQNGRDTSFLYEGVRLSHAKRWASDKLSSLNSLELEFLFASIIEEGTEIDEWICRYGNVEKTLELARKYISEEAVNKRVKGLSILGPLFALNGSNDVDELLFKTIIEDESDDVRFRAAEVLSEGGRSQWLVEQLTKPENRVHLKRLIPAVHHIRNSPGRGLEIEQAIRRILPRSQRRSIQIKSMLRLIGKYKAQFGFVLFCTFLAIQFTLQAVSRLSSMVESFLLSGDHPVGLPYGTFSLVATMMCGLYVLLRARLDGEPISIRTCFRAAFWGFFLSDAIFILGRFFELMLQVMSEGVGVSRVWGLTSILLSSIGTLIAMMAVALILRTITRPKLYLRRYVLLSIMASSVALIWSRVIHSNVSFLIYNASLDFNFKLDVAALLLSLLLGVAITLACFIGFRIGLRTAFGSDALSMFFVEGPQREPETNKTIFPAASETQVET